MGQYHTHRQVCANKQKNQVGRSDDDDVFVKSHLRMVCFLSAAVQAA
jgi:hypothetical protein